MHFLGNITPALLSIALSVTSAAAVAVAVPATTSVAPAPQVGCFIPFIIFNSIATPFTLSALPPSKPNAQRSIPVRVVPREPTAERLSKPIISNAKIASTQFKLTNGKLIVDGFEAEILPVIAIFPPPLRAFEWGPNEPGSSLNFTASFACDSNSKPFLQLRVDPTPANTLDGFAVEKYQEGEQVFIKPAQFVGKVTDVRLRINEGS